MKTFRKILIFVTLLYSCSSEQNVKIEPETLKAEEPITEIQLNSTAYHYPELVLPESYYLDTLSILDSISRGSYTSFFVQSTSKGSESFNELMKIDVMDHIKYVQGFVDPYSGDSQFETLFSYLLKPISFYKDDEVISITHIIDEYSEGGNHHNYGWHSFNYDLNKKHEIKFNDVFSVRSTADTLGFISLAEEHVLDNGCIGWGNIQWIDFSFGKDGIYLNPDLSWACGQVRSLFPYNLKSKYMRKR